MKTSHLENFNMKNYLFSGLQNAKKISLQKKSYFSRAFIFLLPDNFLIGKKTFCLEKKSLK